MKKLTCAVSLCLLAGMLVAQDTQKLRLPDASGARFSIAEMESPPANHGDAKVCIWNEDYTGVISMGIDGNYGGDHNYWMSVMDTFGLRMTFYVIASAPDGDLGAGSWTPWDSVRALYAAGHSVQSHTMYHLNGDHNYYEEYKLSKDKLEQEMPYNVCHVVGYAGGAIPNDVDSASLYYHGGRGLNGYVNKANTMRYMDTGNAGWGYNYANVKAVCGLDPSRLSDKYGFVTALTHNIPTDERIARWEDWRYFAALKAKGILWVAGHDEVIQYGQERDTHTLTVNSVTADLISFTLTDSMNDSVFAYPLTVKARLNDNWSDLSAVQNGADLWYRIYVKDGKKYALVKAVPDQGVVTLTRTAAAVTADPVFVPWEGSYEDSVEVTIYSTTDGAAIYLTTDGSDPDAGDTEYTGSFMQYRSAVIKAVAIHGTSGSSGITSADYDLVIDSIPPVLDAVAAGGKNTEVVLSFDGPMNSILANDAANYVIDNGVTVSAAVLQDNERTVILTVSALSEGTPYVLTVGNVMDVKNNTIAANTQKAFTFTPAVVEANLQGYWNFNEASGSFFALDMTGNGATGIFTGGAVHQSDRHGNALYFDGDEALVNVGPSQFGIKAANEFTVAFWMKYEEWVSGASMVTRGAQPYSISFHYNGPMIRSICRTTGGTSYLSGATSMTADQWHHVAMTFSDTTYRCYIDGVFDAELQTKSGDVSQNTTSSTLFGQSYQGWLDEVRIYDRALTVADLAVLYADSTDTGQTTAMALPEGPQIVPTVMVNPLSPGQARMLPGTVYRTDGAVPAQLKAGVYLWQDGSMLRKIMITE